MPKLLPPLAHRPSVFLIRRDAVGVEEEFVDDVHVALDVPRDGLGFAQPDEKVVMFGAPPGREAGLGRCGRVETSLGCWRCRGRLQGYLRVWIVGGHGRAYSADGKIAR